MLPNQCKQKKVQLFRQTELFTERTEAVCDVAQAMKYLHEKKIVFRDLKTENVGLSHGDNRNVLFDFGLSRYLTDSIEDEEDQCHATGMTGSRLTGSGPMQTLRIFRRRIFLCHFGLGGHVLEGSLSDNDHEQAIEFCHC
mmetsp:Transcript_12346/g.25162  ORF Transcript_12346/g.25162 Transcript_12346/m.25162 type:complete len:140 (+) Transcript_12346:154-573(+)